MADSIFSGLAGWFGGNKTKNNAGSYKNGTVNWDYRGGQGDQLDFGYSPDQMADYASKGAGIDNAGALRWNNGTGEVIKQGNWSESTAPNSGSSWFGKDGYLGMGAQVIGAGSSLMNALTGTKALKLAEDQFAHEKGLAAANLYNSGTLANNALQNRTEVGTTLAGNAMTDMEKQAAMDKTKAGFVKTAIG